MSRSELRATVLRVLGDVAPEADLTGLDRAVDVREELDLDSMDVLTFATRLYEATGVDVPERDYAQIVTVDGCVDYLVRRLAER